jgi:predicted RNA methylase
MRYTFQVILFLFFHLFFALFIFFLTVAFLTGAPFVPSNKPTSAMMIELANIKANSVIYDLGSGDGRLLFLAKKKGGKKIVGIEINPLLVLYTNIRILFSRQKEIRTYWGNFWTTNLSDADIVFVYLLPWKMEKLAQKLTRELKPGARIVSNSFIFPKWKLVEEDKKTHVYVFEMRNEYKTL